MNYVSRLIYEAIEEQGHDEFYLEDIAMKLEDCPSKFHSLLELNVFDLETVVSVAKKVRTTPQELLITIQTLKHF